MRRQHAHLPLATLKLTATKEDVPVHQFLSCVFHARHPRSAKTCRCLACVGNHRYLKDPTGSTAFWCRTVSARVGGASLILSPTVLLERLHETWS